jgi:uncharacterized phage protein (TIGR01671 family)
MRDILFKGKRKDNGEWICGYYVKSRYYEGGTIHLIVDTENEYDDYDGFSLQYEIDPDTLCQYTGLTDRNGTKIFESDIVTSTEFCPDNEGYGVIQWHDDEAMFVVEDDNCYYDFDHIFGGELEVIGNVFDNPELIRGVEE